MQRDFVSEQFSEGLLTLSYRKLMRCNLKLWNLVSNVVQLVFLQLTDKRNVDMIFTPLDLQIMIGDLQLIG